MNGPYGSLDLQNYTITGVSVSGTAVTIPSAPLQGFNVNRAAGSKFKLTGCTGSTPSGSLTISQINNSSSITTVESSASGTNCTYTDQSVGIAQKMTTAGTVHASINAYAYSTNGAGYSTSGAFWACATSPVTDILQGVDGTAYPSTAPMSGYLCSPPYQSGGGMWIIQADGKMGVQSSFEQGAVHLTGSGGFLGNNCYISAAFGTSDLYKICHVASNYQAPAKQTSTDLLFTYTDVGPINALALACAANPTGLACTNLSNTALWPAQGFQGIMDNGNGGQVLVFNYWQPGDGVGIDIFVDAFSLAYSGEWSGLGAYPDAYTAIHSSFQGGAGFALISTQNPSYLLGPEAFNNTLSLGGPFMARIAGLMDGTGTYKTLTQTISGCTVNTTTVCTIANNNLDNPPTENGQNAGAQMVISGGTGGCTAVNGTMYAHVASAGSTFTLSSDPQGQVPIAVGSTCTGTITATMSPAAPILNITSESDSFASTGVHGERVLFNFNAGGGAYYPGGVAAGSIAGLFDDYAPVAVIHSTYNSATQYYLKRSCTGCSGMQADVYTDAALTVPVAYPQTWAGYSAAYAMTCPDPTAVTLPGPLYLDSGWGTAGHPNVECLYARLTSNMESDYAYGSGSTGEHAKYPPPVGDARAGTASVSMAHLIAVGDGAQDLSHSLGGSNHELLYTLQVNTSNPNLIPVTMRRCYGNAPGFGGRCDPVASLNPTGNTYAGQHSPGWSMVGTGLINGGQFVPMNSQLPVVIVPPIQGSHNDFSSLNGLISTAVPYAPGGPDAITLASQTAWANNTTSLHNQTVAFGSSASYSANPATAATQTLTQGGAT